MKYIRTKDGRIIDVGKFIEKEKANPYYTDHEFEEIKNGENSCSLNWTAIGTEYNSIKHQVGERCQFGVTIDSPFIKQANTIGKLCDYCIYYNCYDELVIRKMPLSTSLKSLYRDMKSGMVKDIKLAILTDKGLIFVAKMNEKGKLKLL